MTGTTGTTRTTVRTGCRPSRVAAGGTLAGRRALLRRLAALAVAALASCALFAPTVLAHHFTGEVQLWVSTMDFQESPGGVLVTVKLLEREYGESVSGFGVRVAATGNGNVVGPIELQESDFAVYTGVLPLGPGRWEILATAHQGSSSLPAIEAAQRKTLEIDATGRLVTSEDGGSGVATALAIVLPICAVVALLLLVVRRRRSLLDDETDAGDTPDADNSPSAGDSTAATTGGAAARD